MILSVSRRTDIPSYYGDWFMNCLRRGELWVQNPVNHSQKSRLLLSPEAVDCILFWTKDPEPFLKYLPELGQMGYRCCFQYTLNPYGPEWEPGLPSLPERLETFRRLSDCLSPEAVLWRYDPVIVNDEWTPEHHAESFECLCEALRPMTSRVTFSFIHRYQKIRDASIRELTEEEKREIAESFGNIAASLELPVYACCAGMDLQEYGIRPSACVDREQLENLCGAPLDLRRDFSQRAGCGCYESIDVGTYNTCPRGCTYCYATLNRALVERNRRDYDPESPLLCSSCDLFTLRDRPLRSNLQWEQNSQITF